MPAYFAETGPLAVGLTARVYEPSALVLVVGVVVPALSVTFSVPATVTTPVVALRAADIVSAVAQVLTLTAGVTGVPVQPALPAYLTVAVPEAVGLMTTE